MRPPASPPLPKEGIECICHQDLQASLLDFLALASLHQYLTRRRPSASADDEPWPKQPVAGQPAESGPCSTHGCACVTQVGVEYAGVDQQGPAPLPLPFCSSAGRGNKLPHSATI